MQASKKTIDRAIENGSLPSIDRLISASHILTEMADWLIKDADDIARDNNLMLGEVKREQTRYTQNHDRYARLWRDLVNESHMSHERTEDFDHFLPYIARLLSIDDVTTDPNTGESVRAHYKERYEKHAATPQKTAFSVMHGKDESRITYRRAALSEEQREVLGKETKTSLVTHENILRLITAYAEKEGTTRRDILNEALLTYMQANGIADKTN